MCAAQMVSWPHLRNSAIRSLRSNVNRLSPATTNRSSSMPAFSIVNLHIAYRAAAVVVADRCRRPTRLYQDAHIPGLENGLIAPLLKLIDVYMIADHMHVCQALDAPISSSIKLMIGFSPMGMSAFARPCALSFKTRSVARRQYYGLHHSFLKS